QVGHRSHARRRTLAPSAGREIVFLATGSVATGCKNRAMGTTIEFRGNGEMMSGYLAEPPAGKANGRGVVVIQEWWGLVPHITHVVDRFAAEGYLALAPDLWRGERTTKPDEA